MCIRDRLNALPDTTSTLAINQNTVSTSTSQINEARNTGSLVSRGQLKGKAKGLQRIPTCLLYTSVLGLDVNLV